MTYRIFLAVLVALTTLLATHRADARDDGLLGCWKTEKSLSRLADGSVRENKVNCVERIGEQTIERVCADHLGLVRQPVTETYRLLDSGVIEVKGQWEKTSRRVDFTIDGKTLRRSTATAAASSELRAKAPVQVESTATRVPASASADCLPKAAVTTRAEFARHWRIRELIAGGIEGSVESLIVDAFLQRDSGGNGDSKWALAAADRVKAWTELRVLAADASRAASTIIDSLGTSVEDRFFSVGRCEANSDDQLASPEKQRWARDVASEILGSRRALLYWSALPLLADASADELRRSLPDRNQIDDRYGLGGQFQLQRELLLVVSTLPLLSPFLIPSDELGQLRELTLSNSSAANSRYFRTPPCLERALQLTEASLRAQELKTFWSGKEMAQALDKVKLLKARLSLLRDPQASGRCRREQQSFDIRTLRASDGNWEAVRKPSGEALRPDSYEVYELAMAFTSGCHVSKDAALARRILEQWAMQHGDRGKMAEASHCTLASWHRFGIGGPRNPDQAAQWEAHFADATGGHQCHPRLPIDPTDPWKVL